jgi:hypothetical protein
VPDARIVGTLTIHRDGSPELEVACESGETPDGSLPALLQPRNRFGRSSKGSLMVHGQSKSGTMFTLYDGGIPNFSMGMVPMTTATLFFNRGFKGAWIDDPDTLEVSAVFLRCPGMDAWLRARPFDIEHDWKTNKRVVISHTMPDDESFQIDDQRRLVLKWTRDSPGKADVQTRVQMQVLPWLGIKYLTYVTADKASDDAANVAQMLSMFLGSSTTTREIDMISPQHTLQYGDQTHHQELRVLAGQFKLPHSFRKWTTLDVLIPLSDIRSDFEAIVQRWFALRHRCWGVIVPYLVNQRSPAPIAEGRFFDFAAAAESLHAHLRPDEDSCSKLEARQIWKAIRPAIPVERRKAFSSALQRVNALAYRDRLERLFARFPTLVQDVIGDAEEQAAFCKSVKDIRNTLAHRLTRTEQTNPGGSKLVRMASKLKTILDAWILAEIGIVEPAVEEAMRENPKYWFYASRKTWPWNIPSTD